MNTQTLCEERMRKCLGTVETKVLAGLWRCLNGQSSFESLPWLLPQALLP